MGRQVGSGSAQLGVGIAPDLAGRPFRENGYDELDMRSEEAAQTTARYSTRDIHLVNN